MEFTVTCYKATRSGGEKMLERYHFATEQEAMEYAIICRRCYDNAGMGNDARVTVSEGRLPGGAVADELPEPA